MAETPEGLVEDMLVSNAPSPHDAPNGRITDADGDVNMEQVMHVNGHAETTDIKLDDSFAACRSPNHLVSPRQVDADVDDDARPPPAKRARKFSDADQASIANVSQALPSHSRALMPRIHQDRLSSSCYRFFHSDE